MELPRLIGGAYYPEIQVELLRSGLRALRPGAENTHNIDIMAVCFGSLEFRR